MLLLLLGETSVPVAASPWNSGQHVYIWKLLQGSQPGCYTIFLWDCKNMAAKYTNFKSLAYTTRERWHQRHTSLHMYSMFFKLTHHLTSQSPRTNSPTVGVDRFPHIETRQAQFNEGSSTKQNDHLFKRTYSTQGFCSRP